MLRPPEGQVDYANRGSVERDRLLILRIEYSARSQPAATAADLGAVREARIKVPPAEGEAVYHCISRTVNGERLFDDMAKEILRRQFWQVAEYCGVQILTYNLLSNHFHVLARVPQQQIVPDAELIRRYRILYPNLTRYQAARLDVIEAELRANGPRATDWRRRQMALMGDVSPFMKLVKQRFSIWYNKSHRRFGTLWAERFKSTLIEPSGRSVETVAAYIDLNAVRAGLVTDPKDYRFCGYAEAVAGGESARDGIRAIMDGRNWDAVQAGYRQLLFGTGAIRRDSAASIPMDDARRVISEGGKLPLAAVLRCRLRYFSDGAVLGSQAFVQTQLARYRLKTGRRTGALPRPLPAWMDLNELAILRLPRRCVIE